MRGGRPPSDKSRKVKIKIKYMFEHKIDESNLDELVSVTNKNKNKAAEIST